MRLFPRPSHINILLHLLCFNLVLGIVQARIWTSRDGKTIEADYVRQTGTDVVLKVKGKETVLPVDRLSAADVEYIAKVEEAAREAKAQKMRLGDQAVVPGQTVSITVPLTNPLRRKSVDEVLLANNKASVQMTFGAAPAFDPEAANNRVLIVHSGNVGKNESAAEAVRYEKIAFAQGWCVLTTDGLSPVGGWQAFEEYRQGLTSVAVAYLESAWPKSHGWIYAHAGHAGAAFSAPFSALGMLEEGYRVAGTFASNGAISSMDPDNRSLKEFRKIPIFLSYGKQDSGVDSQVIANSINALEKGHFRKTRYKAHNGAKELSTQHLAEALTWFAGEITTQGPPTAKPKP